MHAPPEILKRHTQSGIRNTCKRACETAQTACMMSVGFGCFDHEPSASLGVYAEVKRGKPVMETKAAPNSGDETATFQVGVIHYS